MLGIFQESSIFHTANAKKSCLHTSDCLASGSLSFQLWHGPPPWSLASATPPNWEAVPRHRLGRPAWREAPGRWGPPKVFFFVAGKEAAQEGWKPGENLLEKTVECWTSRGQSVEPRMTKTSQPPWRELQPAPAQVVQPRKIVTFRSSQSSGWTSKTASSMVDLQDPKMDWYESVPGVWPYFRGIFPEI